MSVVASTIDAQSTIYGIAAKGWAGFGESNHILRLLYPALGIWAPVAYLPLEAAGFVAASLLAFMIGIAWRIALKRGVPNEFPRILYLIAVFPVVAAAGNVLFVFGVI